jgi:hypothetical protein
MDIGTVNKDYRVSALDKLNNGEYKILFDQQFLPEVKDNYKNINFYFDPEFHNDFILKDTVGLSGLVLQNSEPAFKTFISCFNHGGNVGRQFLTSALYKLRMWNDGYCTKYFTSPRDQIDGNIMQYLTNSNNERFYRKFIIDDTIEADTFYNNKITANVTLVQSGRLSNLPQMTGRIKDSFIFLVSESSPESYQTYYTEKFLFGVITRSLWIANAQPNWHSRLVSTYGFRLFNNIFNYTFDTVQNPVERTVALLSMLLKFKDLSRADWHDLYLMEKDTIDFNHDHYYSKDYLLHLKESNGNKF